MLVEVTREEFFQKIIGDKLESVVFKFTFMVNDLFLGSVVK